MKQLLVLSGKGGTGKTTISSALIDLLQVDAYGDCDVDAPNLHLVVPQLNTVTERPFFGMDIFSIDPNKCINCGLCLRECRFHAIDINEKHYINPVKCEGCAFCAEICPTHAIHPVKAPIGKTQVSTDGKTLFSTARLAIGKGNSGLLVSEVKRPIEDQKDWDGIAILDGSPGIGCPVIASIRGVDYILIVTEPNIAAFHDLERLLKTIHHFMIPCAVCINKSDVSIIMRDQIIEYCEKNRINILGEISYDSRITKGLNERIRLIDSGSSFRDEMIVLKNNLLNWINSVTLV